MALPEQDEAIGQDAAEDLPATVARLEQRVATLERLAELVDLLALPGMLAGGAAQIFTSGFDAVDVPNGLSGVFPLERNGKGLPFRWFAFPGRFDLRVPVIAGISSVVKIVTLDMAHLDGPSAFIFEAAEDVVVTPLGLDHLDGGLLAMQARVEAPTTRLAAVAIGSRAGLETGGRDARSLGLPFVKAQYRPEL